MPLESALTALYESLDFDELNKIVAEAKALILETANYEGSWSEFLVEEDFCELDEDGNLVGLVVLNNIYIAGTWDAFIDAFLKVYALYDSYAVLPQSEIDKVVSDFRGVIDSLEFVPSDAELLQALAPVILRNGLKTNQLVLSSNKNATLTLVLEDREIVLATGVNNRNVSGRVELPDGSGTLVFDIKGNGSNIKVWYVIPAEIPIVEVIIVDDPVVDDLYEVFDDIE